MNEAQAMRKALKLMATNRIPGILTEPRPDRRIDHSKDIHKPKDQVKKAKHRRQMAAASRKHNR